MIYKHIKIPMYNSELLFVQMTANTKKKELKRIFKKFDFEDPTKYENVEVNKRAYDGGWTIHNYDRKQFAIILTRCTSKKTYINILLHEKRHVEDLILTMCGIEDDETAAYLAGNLGEKLIEFIEV